MGQITSAYRVVYEAKGFRTGLTNVVAAVLKPDLTVSGPFPMPELPGIFKGRYYFDLITDPSDPQGEYLVLMVSPSESTQTTFRIPLYQSAAQAITETVPTILNVQLGDVSGAVTQLQTIIDSLNTAVFGLSSDLASLSLDIPQINTGLTNLGTVVNQLSGLARTIVSAVIPANIRGGVKDTGPIRGRVLDLTKTESELDDQARTIRAKLTDSDLERQIGDLDELVENIGETGDLKATISDQGELP